MVQGRSGFGAVIFVDQDRAPALIFSQLDDAIAIRVKNLLYPFFIEGDHVYYVFRRLDNNFMHAKSRHSLTNAIRLFSPSPFVNESRISIRDDAEGPGGDRGVRAVGFISEDRGRRHGFIADAKWAWFGPGGFILAGAALRSFSSLGGYNNPSVDNGIFSELGHEGSRLKVRQKV